MRLWLCLVGLAFLLGSCFVGSSLIITDADIEDSVNLLLNPGFNPYSVSGKDALKGWDIHIEPRDPGYDKITVDPLQALEGQTSLRISASENDVMLLSAPFRVRRYGAYYCRISARSDSPQAPQLTFRMITFKDNGKITNRFKKKFVPGTDWTKATISAGFLKPGVNFGRLAILIPPFSEGSIWLDDAGCWEVHGFNID
ncbi:MAG TPA: hypothetical protein PKI59_04655 [Candidatus Cloacimonadota bacterium]|nr:hypothetical protein [Candidatus Cloacimonadota bacterium]